MIVHKLVDVVSFKECKTLFEELSGIMRTVLASRSEIVEYDRRQQFAISGIPSSDIKIRVKLVIKDSFNLFNEITPGKVYFMLLI